MKLILLNGTLCSPLLWSEVCATLKYQLKNVECEFFDISTGKSISDFANELFKQVSTYGEKPWLLGFSLGGIVALEFARQFQESIQGLILVCVNHRGQSPEKERALQAQLNFLTQGNLDELFDKILLPAYFGNALYTYQNEAQQIKTMGVSLGKEVLINQLTTLRTRKDQREHLHEIHIPVQLVCGELDSLCTLEDNREMENLLPNSNLYVFKELGHFIPMLKSKNLAEIISKFIKNR